jgi:hypothetical protein
MGLSVVGQISEPFKDAAMASEADGPSNANRSKIEIQLLHNRLPIQNKTLRGQCSNVYFAELQTKLQARGGMSIVELENRCARKGTGRSSIGLCDLQGT